MLAKVGIDLRTEGAAQLLPEENRIELVGGDSVPDHYHVVATAPDLAFDEVPGFGLEGHTQSIGSVSV